MTVDPATRTAIDTAQHGYELGFNSGYFEGYMSCLRCLLKAYDEGRLNDEWVRDVRESLALHEEDDG